jgi:hypothetical protein
MVAFKCSRIVEDFCRLAETDRVLGKILNSLFIIPLEPQFRFLFVILCSHFRNCELDEIARRLSCSEFRLQAVCNADTNRLKAELRTKAPTSRRTPNHFATSFRTYNSKSTPGRRPKLPSPLAELNWT